MSEPQPERPPGRIITFYSYKGGVGRTMAAANVAWILAANGFRVLASDWDLETPGLHHYFSPFLPPDTISSTTGLIDLFADFAVEARSLPRRERGPDLYRLHARVRPHAVSVDWPFPGGGSLDFLSAGRRNRDYLSTLASFDWSDLDEPFLDALRQEYDFALLDSRTGLGDAVEICTRDLPDILVSCFTLNSQSIEGASSTARYIDKNAPSHGIIILPVPMRINERADPRTVAAARRRARAGFGGLPRGLSAGETDRYWQHTEIPYRSSYDREEILAAFGEQRGQADGLLQAYEQLTALVTGGRVTGLPPLDETLRVQHLGSFIRSRPLDAVPLLLLHAPRDRMWAEWLTWVLDRVGFEVLGQDTADVPDGVRTVVVLSEAFLRTRTGERIRQQTLTAAQDLMPVLLRVDAATDALHAVRLAALDEEAAVTAVLQAVGAVRPPADGQPGPRFPGRGPAVSGLPARNPQFVGRDALLDQIHDVLGVSRSLALTAAEPGGLGRRQLALEYAHRFDGDYDLVWWVPAASREAALSALTRLARKLALTTVQNAESAAAAALRALASGAEPDRIGRWLLVYEDAGAPADLEGLLPAGPGRTLITTAAPGWAAAGFEVLPTLPFHPAEGVELLLSRLPELSRADAGELVEAVQCLPLPVHQVARALVRSGETAGHYLGRLSLAPGRDCASTWAAWAALKTSSPAACRLLQLCCSLATAPVPLALVQTQAVLAVLARLDPALTSQLQLGPLVLELDQVGLVEVDQAMQRLRVAGLVRRTVRAEFTAEERAPLRHEAHRMLAAAAPTADEDEDSWHGRREFEELWPHFDACEAELCTRPGTRAALVERVRRTARMIGPNAAVAVALRLDQAWKLADDGASGAHRPELDAELRRLGR